MLAEGALRKAATTATSPPASAIWTERVEIVPRRPYPAVDMYSSFLGEVGLQVGLPRGASAIQHEPPSARNIPVT